MNESIADVNNYNSTTFRSMHFFVVIIESSDIASKILSRGSVCQLMEP